MRRVAGVVPAIDETVTMLSEPTHVIWQVEIRHKFDMLSEELVWVNIVLQGKLHRHGVNLLCTCDGIELEVEHNRMDSQRRI